MHSAKKLLATAAIVLSFMLTDTARADIASAPSSDTVVIQVSGKVPGFTQAQLAAYLARKMQEETAIHFAAGEPGENPAPNRVAWSFKTLRKVWKGGTHEGFPSPAYSISYLSAEVKLYLKGEYQMTMGTHPSVMNGDEDQSLSEMAKYVTRALFVENRPGKP